MLIIYDYSGAATQGAEVPFHVFMEVSLSLSRSLLDIGVCFWENAFFFFLMQTSSGRFSSFLFTAVCRSTRVHA